ncbi:MAG: ASKHA domain-containing protein [Candidatus Thorarchaeota archaeon]|nr:ASKHA domain-containing protein [Candidatus Thorarchaeota archaeon]
MKKHLLILESSGQRILVTEGITYLEAIRESGLYVPSECGGRGTCGKCKIAITPTLQTSQSDRRHLSKNELDRGVRLACNHTIDTDSRIVASGALPDMRILTEGVSDVIEPMIDEGRSGEYGAAIDIGTTTIVVYLLDLGTGQQLAATSELNPQVAYGEDIVTRLTSAKESDANRQALQSQVVGTIESLLIKALNASNIRKSALTNLSVVGNTVMHHFFLGLDTSTLSVAPFSPALKSAQVVQTKLLGFDEINAKAYCGPLIGGFVGSDITSLIISQNLHETDDIVLGIDIGTNGEIVLSNKGDLYAASTAAGSAFEGATISRGMRGQVGAIEHVTISEVNEPPEITVIGYTTPKGLCGSAIVDVVAELRKVNLVSIEGRLSESKRILREPINSLGYIVVDTTEHGRKERILFTQKDIRQVQLAKAAINAGSMVLLNIAGVPVDSIDRILLAGAFGSYIQPMSALRIGLIPDVSIERILQVGNTAGQGAKMMLLSSDICRLAEEIVKSINHIELAGNMKFQKEFVRATQFPAFHQKSNSE